MKEELIALIVKRFGSKPILLTPFWGRGGSEGDPDIWVFALKGMDSPIFAFPFEGKWDIYTSQHEVIVPGE